MSFRELPSTQSAIDALLKGCTIINGGPLTLLKDFQGVLDLSQFTEILGALQIENVSGLKGIRADNLEYLGSLEVREANGLSLDFPQLSAVPFGIDIEIKLLGKAAGLDFPVLNYTNSLRVYGPVAK